MEYILLSPLTVAAFLGLLLAIAWRWLPRWLRCLGVGIEVLLFLLMTPLAANLLARAVESRAPSPRSCERPYPDTIVVLSGGFDRPPISDQDFSAASGETLHRLFAGVDLWRRTPGAALVVAGGGEYSVSQGALLAQLAIRLGVPAEAIRSERDSQTTWQNARNIAAMSPRVSRRIWLVSSSLHLPRALEAFRAFGFRPCAWSSGSIYLPPEGIGYLVPQDSSLNKTEAALHELVGGVVYSWRARKQEAPAARTANR